MKVKHLGVIVISDEGSVYQVLLTPEEEESVKDLIGQMHGGKVKVLDRELEGITIEKGSA